MKRLTTVFVLMMAVGCSDSSMEESPMTMPTAMPMEPTLERAAFEMTARVLGPVEHDDDADLRIVLRETNGVASRLNFLRMTCVNGVEREWGAGNITAERGSNRIGGNSEVVFVRHYFCPSSGRPSRLEADLTDVNGHQHSVLAFPFHPDWPGT